MKRKFEMLIVILYISSLGVSHAQINMNRRFEPIVMSGDSLLKNSSFENTDISHLYLYAYDAALDNWAVIPFQIDEVNPAVNDSIKFFIPEDSLGGLFDLDDELVFMAADLGDAADSSHWLESADTTRLEIEIMDPMDGEKAYVYLYNIMNSNPTVPTYEMSFDSLNDRISSANYELGFTEKTGEDINHTGQLNDVIIKSGSGEDIFDRLKIRAIGSWWIIPIFLYEEMIEAHSAYAKAGPVRVIRNMAGSFIYELLEVDKPFTQTSIFYPWHGSFRLVDIPLGDAKDFGAEVDELRVSWDFNVKSSGMQFFSEYNRDNITIDGINDDVVDKSLVPDELNWSMGTGNQGTILNIFNVPALGDAVEIYYYDETDGSVGDRSVLSVDTGDMLSYGDNGFALIDNIENYITTETSFSAIYYNYFLPPNFDPNEASRINEQIKYPLIASASSQEFAPVTTVREYGRISPEGFSLTQNFPNPFNSGTIISFSIPSAMYVSVKIYDTLGKTTRHLVDQQLNSGTHLRIWDGTNDRNIAVPSGIYIYEIKTSHYSATKKLLFIK